MTSINGTLEIDHERGVIYFHADEVETKTWEVPTPLRLCGLPRPIPEIHGRMLDITVRPIRLEGPEHAHFVVLFDWAERTDVPSRG